VNERICVWGTSLKKVADEAQVVALIAILSKRFPGVSVTLFSKYGELMTDFIAQHAFKVRTIRTANVARVFWALSRSRLFVIVGGPFFEDLFQTLVCIVLVCVAKLFGLPVITYGTTVFPFKTRWGSFIFRNLFNQMQAITVREPVAVQILEELGISKDVALFADPRFTLQPPPSTEIREILLQEGVDPDRPIVGITTRYLDEDLPAWVQRSHFYTPARVSRANDALARAAAHLAELAQVILIPMHPSYEDDIRMAGVIRSHMGDAARLKVLSRRYSAAQVLGIIGHCQLLFASRLGSAVFATVTGTPVVAIAYEPRMLDHMKRVGLDEFVVDWRDISYPKLAGIIDDLWRGGDRVKARMDQRATEFRALAWRNAEILAEYI
jgi:polysaccharide pyruvyl transferase WcaK-like protein